MRSHWSWLLFILLPLTSLGRPDGGISAVHAPGARRVQSEVGARLWQQLEWTLKRRTFQSARRMLADRYQEQVAAWHRQKLLQHSERESRWTSDPGSLEIDGFPQPTFTLPPLSQRIASSVSLFSILTLLRSREH